MKTFLLATASCFLGLASLRADLTIVQKIEGLGQATESVTKYKDGKTRMDVAAGPTVLMDAKTGETISLIHPQKRYLKAPAEVVQAAVESMKGDGPQGAHDKPQLVATGKKETVAGYAVDEYTASVAGSKVTLWLTKEIPHYEEASRELGAAFKQGPLAAMSQNLGLDLSNLPGFPVRTINERGPGETVTITLVSVSLEPIPDTEFVVPPGYEEIKSAELTPRAAMPKTKPTP